MSTESDLLAQNFIDNEKQFHLGFLPTEQSNPKSKNMEADFKCSAAKGVRCMQNIDLDVSAMADRVFASGEYALLVDAIEGAIIDGRRVVFSGCGATGRLSILLDGMWGKACNDDPILKDKRNAVGSIMTGGDYALVRSVEFFEDYAEFGRQQVREAGLTKGDVLVAITEGGETSSVLGTVDEALDRGVKCFLLFNNPAGLLADHLERSRKAIQDKRVTVLDLFCGPMALSGSTRLQATTSEQLVAGAALETAACRLKGDAVPNYASRFKELLRVLMGESNVNAIGSYIEFEESVYRNQGKITYYTDSCLLDIFTDTTERCPTFMTPPFCRKDTPALPQSWAFVKHPRLKTGEAWAHLLHRPLQCLAWESDDYKRMGAAADIAGKPPRIAKEDLLMFEIGCEPAPLRWGSPFDAAVAVQVQGDSRISVPEKFPVRKVLSFGFPGASDFLIDFPDYDSPLNLMRHMAVKMALNIISTGIMVRLGRVSGNWMSWVDLSNKKLLDRGVRLLVELSRLPYSQACQLLFASKEECEKHPEYLKKYGSVVQYALTKASTFEFR